MLPNRSAVYLVLGSALALCPTAGFSQAPDKKSAGARADFAKDIAPLLTKYCVHCHGGAKPKAGLSLAFKSMAEAGKKPQVWEKVAAQLSAGEMPPSGRPKLEAKEMELLTGWLHDDMLGGDCKGRRDPGRVTIRRLNRAEYNNTVRDLLFIKDFKPADDFPSDDVGYGFDNIADVLSLSPLLLEKYLAAAEKAVELAFQNQEIRARFLAQGKGKTKRIDRAQAVIEGFAGRAYRRPAGPAEVARLVRFVELAEQNGQPFEKGVQLAFQAALVSPHFLFRVEMDRNNPKIEPFAIQPISEYELASRLSYFLWSSMPDDELLGQAESKSLRTNLEAQVRRMLQDPKTHALTENFAGQWLQLRSLPGAQPDPKLFPAFKEPLRRAMQEETERFFEAVVKEDRSILDFLDAEFTFVNETLAKHYGIPGIKGPEFQRVKLDKAKRGGVLTHASILTVTSNPTRTSPVKRGKWILENILNSPPPPPPPDVPELEENAKELKGSLRERMEQHRAKPICASCHQRMDPLGFAFENFDAIGAWRDKDGKFAIDAAGTLPTGQSFKGARELSGILRERAPEFRRCLAEKMLTFGLGRGLEYYDKCALDDICAGAAKGEDRFSSLVIAIVKSDPFQLRKGRGFKQ
jgi:mono/diheme cytochrome c family protein